MISKTIFPGQYLQGPKAFRHLFHELKKFGNSGLFIMTLSCHKRMANRLSVKEENINIFIEEFNGECSDREINRLSGIALQQKNDFIVAIGGGKAIDIGKIVASRCKVPVAVVPTIASTDAPCSACAVVYDENGAVLRVEYQANNPQLVLVDSEIICEAPSRFLVSGMGDALATWFEAEQCRLSQSKNEADGYGSLTAFALSRLCYETLLKNGLDALKACNKKKVTPALEKVIEANTLLSGLGFESGGIATAHAIHNGLTTLPQTHRFYHGEKVAFGVLSLLFLHKETKLLIDEVYSFCESVGLPTTLADIGLEKITDEELEMVANRTCRQGESIYHEVRKMTPELVKEIILAADKEGRRRKHH
jgi:glycerol dehydrogenase